MGGETQMPKATTITVERIEIKKSKIEKVKRAFKIKNDGEAIQKAIDVLSDTIDLKAIFEKHKGVKIKKVYD